MRKILSLLSVPLILVTGLAAYVKWGVIEIEITNTPPTILDVIFRSDTMIINKTTIKLADAAGNPIKYYLLVNISDKNTLEDLKSITINFYTTNCNNPFCNYTIIYNLTTGDIIKIPNRNDLNVNITLPNLTMENGTFIFTITFPKASQHVGSYNWSIKVSVRDSSDNEDTHILENLFDFDYYAEYNIESHLKVGPISPNTIIIVNSWINITSINANTRISIYTNNTYFVDERGNNVTSWPVSYVNFTINKNTFTLGKNPQGIDINGPSENLNIPLNWKIKVPKGISSGSYRFYYFVKLEAK